VAAVERHLVALRPTYTVTIGGEKAADVRKHFFTPFRDRFMVDIPGPGDLEVTGGLLDHEFRSSTRGRAGGRGVEAVVQLVGYLRRPGRRGPRLQTPRVWAFRWVGLASRLARG
jgi:hypothetical protein